MFRYHKHPSSRIRYHPDESVQRANPIAPHPFHPHHYPIRPLSPRLSSQPLSNPPLDHIRLTFRIAHDALHSRLVVEFVLDDGELGFWVDGLDGRVFSLGVWGG